MFTNARVSFGKQLPPHPGPAFSMSLPMRGSMPIPVATSNTSAPTASQISAIALMKVSLVARNALAAYLRASADAVFIRRTGALILA